MLAGLLTFLSTLLSEFGYALVKGVVSGDIQRPPTVATEAEADPVIAQRGEDALADWDAKHP